MWAPNPGRLDKAFKILPRLVIGPNRRLHVERHAMISIMFPEYVVWFPFLHMPVSQPVKRLPLTVL